MRGLTFAIAAIFACSPLVPPPPATAQTAKDTPSAERTRTKLLKAKMTVSFTNQPLRECLKELAAQADVEQGKHVMWTYADEIKPDQLVTFECRDKPLDEVLDALFKKPGLGYVVVSQEDDRRDGWVRVVVGDERGFSKRPPAKTPPPATGTGADDDETLAASKLATAKELIVAGKGQTAKPLLMLVAKKYPKTKAGVEAKELLEKMDK